MVCVMDAITMWVGVISKEGKQVLNIGTLTSLTKHLNGRTRSRKVADLVCFKGRGYHCYYIDF
jgi:hypothetical protein